MNRHFLKKDSGTTTQDTALTHKLQLADVGGADDSSRRRQASSLLLLLLLLVRLSLDRLVVCLNPHHGSPPKAGSGFSIFLSSYYHQPHHGEAVSIHNVHHGFDIRIAVLHQRIRFPPSPERLPGPFSTYQSRLR